MKKIFLTLIVCAFAIMAGAQEHEYVEYPHGYIGVQGGVSGLKLRENGGGMQFTPTAAVSFGTNFNPQLGARLNIQGMWSKVKGCCDTYDYKAITGDLDILYNITNAFRSQKYNPFNLYILAGAGLIGTINNSLGTWDDVIDTKDWYNLRAGVIADYRLSKITSLNLEVNGNYMGGSKNTGFGDGKWKLNAFLGLAFKLPFTETRRASTQETPETSQADYEAEAAAAKAKAEAEAAAAAKAKALAAQRRAAEEAAATAAKAAKIEPIKETIFFTIGKTNTAADFDKIVGQTAEWCKKYPEKTVTVDAYADKGTGTATVNARVAQRRATAVANAIKSKGVPADQLKVASHGDKVQPYAENDKNRCVIIVGE